MSVAHVTIRELGRNASRVVRDVEVSGRPALVTKHGRVVAAVVPVDEVELEDFVLANAPEFVRSMREAETNLRGGRTREAFGFLDEMEEEEPAGDTSRARPAGAARHPRSRTKGPGRRSTRARAARGGR
jgi:prevent-host-death family protein